MYWIQNIIVSHNMFVSRVLKLWSDAIAKLTFIAILDVNKCITIWHNEVSYSYVPYAYSIYWIKNSIISHKSSSKALEWFYYNIHFFCNSRCYYNFCHCNELCNILFSKFKPVLNVYMINKKNFGSHPDIESDIVMLNLFWFL